MKLHRQLKPHHLPFWSETTKNRLMVRAVALVKILLPADMNAEGVGF